MDHPTLELLDRWRRGQVAEKEVLAVGRHLATCEQCTSGSASKLGLDAPAESMLDDLTRDEDAPRRFWPLLVAASIAIVIALPLVWRKSSPPPPTPRSIATPITAPVTRPAGDEWTALADRVRNGEAIAEPAFLRELDSHTEVLRGTSGAKQTFDPSGVVLKSDRPAFTWPAPRGARSQVQVFRDDVEVARSGMLTGSRWTSAPQLERGATYTWTVRVEQDGTTDILPASPSPVARFHIIDAASLAAIEAAEARHPGDELLAGIVCARAGLTSEAAGHFRRVTDPRDVEAARRLLHEIERWSR